MILSLSRLDKSVYPEWIKFLKDGGYVVYLSALKMHHYHNNPTTSVFASLLAGSLDNIHEGQKKMKLSEEYQEWKVKWKGKKKSKKNDVPDSPSDLWLQNYQRKRRLGNKFYMFYLLKKFPILKEFRRSR